jgi:hypothetical protein
MCSYYLIHYRSIYFPRLLTFFLIFSFHIFHVLILPSVLIVYPHTNYVCGSSRILAWFISHFLLVRYLELHIKCPVNSHMPSCIGSDTDEWHYFTLLPFSCANCSNYITCESCVGSSLCEWWTEDARCARRGRWVLLNVHEYIVKLFLNRRRKLYKRTSYQVIWQFISYM